MTRKRSSLYVSHPNIASMLFPRHIGSRSFIRVSRAPAMPCRWFLTTSLTALTYIILPLAQPRTSLLLSPLPFLLLTFPLLTFLFLSLFLLLYQLSHLGNATLQKLFLSHFVSLAIGFLFLAKGQLPASIFIHDLQSGGGAGGLDCIYHLFLLFFLVTTIPDLQFFGLNGVKLD